MSDNALCEDGYAYSADQKCCSQNQLQQSPWARFVLPAKAVHENQYGNLINEGYDLKQASTFVGNHFLLSERQRLAVMRSIATNDQLINMKRGSAGRKEEPFYLPFSKILTIMTIQRVAMQLRKSGCLAARFLCFSDQFR